MSDINNAVLSLSEQFQEQFLYFEQKFKERDNQVELLEKRLNEKHNEIQELKTTVAYLSDVVNYLRNSVSQQQVTSSTNIFETKSKEQSRYEENENTALATIMENYNINTSLQKQGSESWQELLKRLQWQPNDTLKFPSSDVFSVLNDIIAYHATGISICLSSAPWTQQPHLNFYYCGNDERILMETNIYYYEATLLFDPKIVLRKQIVSIGLINNVDYIINNHVGWRNGTIGIHSDDGKLFNSSGVGSFLLDTLNKGDVIGVGWDVKALKIFFTKNGKLVYTGSSNQIQYYPAIGVEGVGQCVMVNFGDKPFMFDILSQIRNFSEYGKKLETLHHAFSKKELNAKAEKTTLNTLITLDEVYSAITKEHAETSTKILNEVVKPMDDALKNFEKERKRLVTLSSKQTKTYTDLLNTVEKTKNVYIKLCNEIKSSNYHQMLDGATKIDAEKFIKKIGASSLKLQKAENNYRAAVIKANEGRRVLYEEELPDILNEMEDLVVQQINELKKGSTLFSNYNLMLSLVSESTAISFKTITQAISVEEDLVAFASEKDKGEVIDDVVPLIDDTVLETLNLLLTTNVNKDIVEKVEDIVEDSLTHSENIDGKELGQETGSIDNVNETENTNIVEHVDNDSKEDEGSENKKNEPQKRK
ncbi:hypothetical protein QTN25_005985 [Entamoeba marina]